MPDEFKIVRISTTRVDCLNPQCGKPITFEIKPAGEKSRVGGYSRQGPASLRRLWRHRRVSHQAYPRRQGARVGTELRPPLHSPPSPLRSLPARSGSTGSARHGGHRGLPPASRLGRLYAVSLALLESRSPVAIARPLLAFVVRNACEEHLPAVTRPLQVPCLRNRI